MGHSHYFESSIFVDPNTQNSYTRGFLNPKNKIMVLNPKFGALFRWFVDTIYTERQKKRITSSGRRSLKSTASK